MLVLELRKKNWKTNHCISGNYCHGNHDFQWCCRRYQITQTDVDMQSPLRADCWILIQHRKTIIKATPHQRWDLPTSRIHQSKQTLRLSYITHRQQRYLIFIISYWRWKPNQDKRLFPFIKALPHFNSVYFTATRADPLYSQQIIKLETFNPLISQVTSTFNFANAANPGNKGEQGSSAQPKTHM